jgi:hypothetical protein
MEVSGQLQARERAPSTHWIRDWVGRRAGLDDVERRKILPLLFERRLEENIKTDINKFYLCIYLFNDAV